MHDCCSALIHEVGYKKLSVCPRTALAWSPWKELNQEQATSKASKIMKATSKAFRNEYHRGVRASHPHGSNCVNIDIYRVKPGKHVAFKAGKTFTTSPGDLFPTAVGVFGPLMLPRPRSTKPLLEEYGAACLKKREVKIITAGGTSGKRIRIDDADDIRFAAWPTQPLVNLGSIARS